MIHIAIFDRDIMTADDYIAEASIPLMGVF